MSYTNYGFDHRIVTEALVALRESVQQDDSLDGVQKALKLRDIQQQINWFSKSTNHLNVASSGGAHFGCIREWIQWNCVNGSDVTWGSDDVLNMKRNVTPKLLEEIACVVAASVINEVKGLR